MRKNDHLTDVSGKRAAFTLIEVLAVIGIIGLLMSLILPAIHYARSRAWATQCRANLRQIGSAMNLYIAERNGALPQYVLDLSGLTEDVDLSYYHWMSTNGMLRYLSGETAYGDEKDPDNPFGVGINTVLICPTVAFQVKKNVTGYGINRSTVPADVSQLGRFRMSSVRSPSTKVMFLDTKRMEGGELDFPHSFLPHDVFHTASCRHPNDTLNALFLDGHVEVLASNDITGAEAQTKYFDLWE